MLALLLAGRVARRQLLEGPDGAWRDDLWLDALVDNGAGDDAAGAGEMPARTPAAGLPAPAGPDQDTGTPAGPEREPAAARPPARPREHGAAGPASGRARKAALTAPLDINTCPPDSLLLLPGVGPVLAARLDEARRAGKVFRSPSDLLGIKGIGPAAVSRLSPLIRFADGVPPVAAASAATAAGADNPH